MLQVDQCAVDVVRQERAAGAAFLPARTEHEVIGHELAAAVEQVGQAPPALRAFECVDLIHADPRQLAALGAQLVAQPGEFLLFPQVLPAGLEPLFPGYDWVILHACSVMRVLTKDDPAAPDSTYPP
jgi:hypothetical protein